jgi:hypothetical protein
MGDPVTGVQTCALPIYDAPIDQMTIKDLAAILWQSPVSDKSFLNQLIKERWPKHA